MATDPATVAAGASGFEAEIDLSTLDGANGFQINGEGGETRAATRSPRRGT